MKGPRDEKSFKRLLTGELSSFIGGLVVLVVLLIWLREFVNPITIGVVGGLVCWPYRHSKGVRAVMLAGAFIVLAWLVHRLGIVLVPFVFAYVLGYVFNPTISYLEKHYRIKRWLSSLVVTLAIVFVVAMLFVTLVPQIFSEVVSLTSRIGGQVANLQDRVVSSLILDRLENVGLLDKDVFLASVTRVVQEKAADVANMLPSTLLNVAASIGSLMQIVTLGTILPVIIFYTLKDYPGVRSKIVDSFPTVDGRRDYVQTAGGIFGKYLRGQLVISAIAMFNVSVVLTLLDIPFALLIGLLAGVLNLIPNIGIIITNVIAALITVLFGDPWLLQTILVLAVIGAQSLLEGAVLVPRIQSNQVGLHPLLVIMSLFVFGALMGLVGLLIAVPATAFFAVVYATWRETNTLELGEAFE